MTAWRWCELFPPRGMTQTDVTAVVRVLTGRPRFGALGLQPLVVFELWLHPGRVRWLVGIDERIADRLPGEFRAQCRGLAVVPLPDPQRPVPVAGRELRTRSLTYPVRVDTAEGVTAALLRIREDLRGSEAVVVQFVVGPGHVFSTDYPQQPTPLDLLGITIPPEPNADDRKAWRRKLSEPLFGIRGRTGAVAADRRRAASLTRPVFSALALTNDRHGRVQVSAQSGRVAAQITKVMGRARTWSSIVNAAELAALIGWSISELDVPGTGGRFAPAPSKLLVSSSTNTGRLLGASLHPADADKLVRVPTATSRHHLHLIGPTGSGKSTLLAAMARADAAAGRALLVLEPRGDLVEDILRGIPEQRRDDVVVIEPGAAHSVGINPLRGPREDAERRADQLVHLFEGWFGSNIGPRSRDVLLHCLIALARLSDGTLADMPTLLTQPRFRRDVLARVSDPLVLAPFFAWYEQISEAERRQAVAPVLNKLRALLSPSAIRRLLGQAAPKFELTDLFTRRRIVLINLNAGVLGPDNANFIGSVLLTELWWAIQRRATIAPEQRHTTMVIVDEVQNYLSSAIGFGDVLAQSRGLGVSWTLAHQHLDQLSPNLQADFLTNARSRVVFRPTKDARALAAALGGGLTAEDLERLQAFEAGCRLLLDSTLTTPFAVRTQPLAPALSDAETLRRTSQDRYGVDGAELDAALAQRWRGAADQPDAPIGVKRRRTT
jgi:DNA helicase HerA-like ATPase